MLCRHIGLLFGRTRFFYVIGFKNVWIHQSSDLVGIYFFPLGRADSKISEFAAEFAGCVWTEAVSGKKKLRIQKYPDTCGRDLKLVFI